MNRQQPTGYYRRGMTARQLNVAARQYREARDREMARSERAMLAVMEEARRLTASRTDTRPGGDKPRLAAARVKLRLIESKSKPATVAPAPKSRTPRLDTYQPLLRGMEERLRALESSIARPPRQAGEPIEIDVRWSRHIP